MTTLTPVFDGHNDVLLRLWRRHGSRAEAFLQGTDDGHLDLPRARQGGLAGGFFAIFVPSPVGRGTPDGPMGMPAQPLPVEQASALATTLAMAALLFRIERESEGAFEVVKDIRALRRCIEDGRMAAIFHVEGVEALDTNLDTLEILYQAGLRSLGPVWSRSNAFGHGVPFTFPSSPDTGPGLTEPGQELVRACNRLGILIDLSHLNEKGFWDVARLSDAPLVATHSNAHALCGTSRNLTDRQLDAVRESKGVVGVNYATGFVRADGKHDADTPLSALADHVDYLAERLGIEGVALGSDFDGATIPAEMGDVAGLPRLLETLRGRGYDDDAIARIAYRNWLDVLARTWKG
ncbi:dipeptidase [Marinivivus vitaminiproducens]|uniref:dipeptidase n=1 Tax=Marinivivus vitaminiproducens TaxID=3035935 RepID=UPI0027A94F2E|nr:dipeptidase [Geminicoccaceae bacterium SCSIO 64248]